METRRIGSLTVSVVSVGCTTLGRELDEAGSARLVDEAIDAGINFFDTADGYGVPRGSSETNLGLALQGGKRDRVVVATKFGSRLKDNVQQPGGGTPEQVRVSVEASLKRLRTDRIDLLQLHRPDPGTPIADTLGALRDLQKQGKVVEIGSSNFSAAQLAEAAAVDGGFVSVQNEYNLLHRESEAEVLPYCAKSRTAFMPWYPLANGLLTGKYRKNATTPAGARLTEDAVRRETFVNDRNLDVVEKLIAYAESRGHTVLELAFAWLLATPAIASVIAGMRSGAQARSNVAAAGAWTMNAEEKRAVDAIASVS